MPRRSPRVAGVRRDLSKHKEGLMKRSGLATLLVASLLIQSMPARANPTPEDERIEATAVKVIDGETVDILAGGREYTVRYLGIDVPERTEPYHEEARELNECLVLGKKVCLEKHVTDEDECGWLLAYVYVDDVFVNVELARQGYAFVYRCGVSGDSEHYKELKRAADKAADGRIGIYGLPPNNFSSLKEGRGEYHLPLSYRMDGLISCFMSCVSYIRTFIILPFLFCSDGGYFSPGLSDMVVASAALCSSDFWLETIEEQLENYSWRELVPWACFLVACFPLVTCYSILGTWCFFTGLELWG